MSLRKQQDRCDLIEDAIRRAGSIGDLERLAGIGQSHDKRFAFWHAYAHLSAGEALDSGVAALKHRIRAAAAPTQGTASKHA